MYRFILLLVLWPVCTQAATPFISLGFAPLVTVFEYPGESEPAQYEENFVAVGGAATIGLSSRVHEWYARFTWSNSEEARRQFTSSTYIEDVADIYLTQNEADRWQNQRLTLGYRRQLVRSEGKSLVGFVGGGLSAGTVLWRQEHARTSWTYSWETGQYESEESKWQEAQYSLYNFGGSVELGGRAAIAGNLSFETSAVLNIDRPVFDANGESCISNNKAGAVIEPSLLLALRWEMR